MAPMEKSFYLISWRPAFFELLQSIDHSMVAGQQEIQLERALVAISQGGFGQDVTDYLVQVKERFLEYSCQEYDLDLPRNLETFEQYFELLEPDLIIDLDEEL